MLIPEELNFFDTNPAELFFIALTLGDVRKQSPIWDRNLYVSLCIEVLERNQNRTEPDVVVSVPVVTVRSKHSGIRAIPPITSTDQERLRDSV